MARSEKRLNFSAAQATFMEAVLNDQVELYWDISKLWCLARKLARRGNDLHQVRSYHMPVAVAHPRTQPEALNRTMRNCLPLIPPGASF